MPPKPKLSINFTSRDLGLKHILKETKKMSRRPFVKAGVTQARGSKLRSDGKKTNAEIAQIHEYGAPAAGIPERSFLRSTRNKNQAKYNKLIDTLRDQIFDQSSGITTEKALGIIGQAYIADVKNAIREGISPALAESTIRSKNAGQISKAEGSVRALNSKAKLTKSDKAKLFKSQELIDTGGGSTPLIDTSAMINSISYEVVMEGQGDASYQGEGPKSY